MNLIALLIALVVVCLVWWAITAVLRAFAIGDPIATLVKVAFVVIVVLWIIANVFGYGGANLRLH